MRYTRHHLFGPYWTFGVGHRALDIESLRLQSL